MVIFKLVQWYFSYFFNSWKRSFLEFRKSDDVSHSLCLINSVNNVSLPWFSFFISLTKFSSVSKFSSKNFKQLSAISLETRSAFVAAITGVHLSLSCKKRDQYKIWIWRTIFSKVRFFWDPSQEMISSSLPLKKQPSDWLTYLVYQLKACFLAGNHLN